MKPKDYLNAEQYDAAYPSPPRQRIEMVDSPYKVAITNIARYIASPRNRSCEDGGMLDGFTAASVLSIAFCKAKEEVLADILRANVK